MAIVSRHGKVGEVRPCSFRDMQADRQTDRQTQTDILITVTAIIVSCRGERSDK